MLVNEMAWGRVIVGFASVLMCYANIADCGPTAQSKQQERSRSLMCADWHQRGRLISCIVCESKLGPLLSHNLARLSSRTHVLLVQLLCRLFWMAARVVPPSASPASALDEWRCFDRRSCFIGDPKHEVLVASGPFVGRRLVERVGQFRW